MKIKIYILVLLFSGYSSLFAQAPTWEWAQSIGSDYALSTTSATDANGNVYTVGYFVSDSVVIGQSTLRGAGMYLVKYDNSGNVLWAKQSMRTAIYSPSLAVDDSGNAFVSGCFYGDSIQFDNILLVGASEFIAKYDPNGNAIWAKKIAEDDAFGWLYWGQNILTSDISGNIFIAGPYASDSIRFGSTTLYNDAGIDLSNPNDSFAESQNFLAKMDGSGNFIWAKTTSSDSVNVYTASDFNLGLTLKTDVNGNVMLGGYFMSDSITSGSITLYNESVNHYNSYLFVFDSYGNTKWGKTAQGLSNVYSLTSDADGNIYSGGLFVNDSCTFDGQSVYNTTGSSVTMFIVKYDSTGILKWCKSTNGGGGATSLMNHGNYIYAAGAFLDPTLTFDTVMVTNAGGATGTTDLFVAKYDTQGNIMWAKSSGGAGYEVSSVGNIPVSPILAINANGDIFLTSYFVGSGVTLDSLNITSQGGVNSFTSKLGVELSNGITSFTKGNSIIAYPNPTQGEIKLISENPIDMIRITNSIGAIQFEGHPYSTNVSLNITLSGIYMITVVSKGQITNTRVIVTN